VLALLNLGSLVHTDAYCCLWPPHEWKSSHVSKGETFYWFLNTTTYHMKGKATMSRTHFLGSVSLSQFYVTFIVWPWQERDSLAHLGNTLRPKTLGSSDQKTISLEMVTFPQNTRMPPCWSAWPEAFEHILQLTVGKTTFASAQKWWSFQDRVSKVQSMTTAETAFILVLVKCGCGQAHFLLLR
jgi:hypothetical protein